MFHRPAQTKPPYGNYRMLSPDGTLLCFCDQKKVQWYVSRGLATMLTDNVMQLLFEPKGNGHAGVPYYTSVKANICVVCGSSEKLTKHHCVPRCFRRYFPPEYKSHCSHDIVLLCGECHGKYEIPADELKVRLMDQYGLSRHLPASDEYKEVKYLSGLARAILVYGRKMPAPRLEALREILREHLQCEPTEQQLLALQEREVALRHKQRGLDRYGSRIVEQIPDIYEFVKMWRRHFLSVMHPKYLPDYWSVDHQES